MAKRAGGQRPEKVARANYTMVARGVLNHGRRGVNGVVEPLDGRAVTQSLRRFDPGHSADDVVATRNWTHLNPEKVVFYQEPSKIHNRPFMLAWQTPWMLSKLASLGHRSTVSMDATFGTNKYGLTDCLETFYYCTSELKRQGHIRNRIVAKFVATAIRKARDIPDSNVIPCTPRDGVSLALVTSKSGHLSFHEVQGWEKDTCSCTCGLSVQGNVCKHQIKCLLLLGGFSEPVLLQRLGLQWGSSCGGIENFNMESMDNDSEYPTMNLPVAELPIHAVEVSSESEAEEDCVILPTPPLASSSISRLGPLADFHREIGKLYSAVSHSTNLCGQAFDFLLRAVNDSLDLKATTEVHDLARQDVGERSVFSPLPGNENTLKRKMDFMDLFHRKKKSSHAKTGVVITKEWTQMNEDNRFQKLPSQNMSMQEVLDKATYHAVDLNVTFTDNKPAQKAMSIPSSNYKASNRGFQRGKASVVGVQNVPTEVIVLE
ncbi:hypothetical protein R1sor_010567 [Riccia sorocarpa]|uniref:SWIM-type domain-containing protein n=1 Tax=Riccia sorocarpa TaxID=122646 RepID=A0ABD3I2G8_9MARC